MPSCVSQELQIEVRFKPEAELMHASPDEIALISAFLPELLKLLQQLDQDEE